MQHTAKRLGLVLSSSLPWSQVMAAPIEGELGSHAAALLMLLGIGALLMGIRNLRELRHKRLLPGRQREARGADFGDR